MSHRAAEAQSAFLKYLSVSRCLLGFVVIQVVKFSALPDNFMRVLRPLIAPDILQKATVL